MNESKLAETLALVSDKLPSSATIARRQKAYQTLCETVRTAHAAMVGDWENNKDNPTAWSDRAWLENTIYIGQIIRQLQHAAFQMGSDVLSQVLGTQEETEDSDESEDDDGPDDDSPEPDFNEPDYIPREPS